MAGLSIGLQEMAVVRLTHPPSCRSGAVLLPVPAQPRGAARAFSALSWGHRIRAEKNLWEAELQLLEELILSVSNCT